MQRFPAHGNANPFCSVENTNPVSQMLNWTSRNVLPVPSVINKSNKIFDLASFYVCVRIRILRPKKKYPLIVFLGSLLLFLLAMPPPEAAVLSLSGVTPSMTHKFPGTLLTWGYRGFLALLWGLWSTGMERGPQLCKKIVFSLMF